MTKPRSEQGRLQRVRVDRRYSTVRTGPIDGAVDYLDGR